MQEYNIVRDSTSNMRETEIRWEILKAMLDHFPELQERTETYLFAKKVYCSPVIQKVPVQQ